MPDCSVCNEKVGRYDDYLKCDNCDKLFHITCVNVSLSEFTLIRRYTGTDKAWRCTACDTTVADVVGIESLEVDHNPSGTGAVKKNTGGKVRSLGPGRAATQCHRTESRNEVIDMSEKCSREIGELKSIIEKLCVQINQQQHQLKFLTEVVTKAMDNNTVLRDKLKNSETITNLSPMVSYKNILLNNTKPAVIVKPKSAQDHVKTKEDIRRNVDPIDAGVNITKIKNLANGSVLVACKDVSDQDKFQKLVGDRLSSAYETKGVRGLTPKVRIAGLSQEYTEVELLRYLTEMNKSMFPVGYVCKVINVSPTKKNKEMFQAVLQVDRDLYSRMMQVGYVLVGYDSCPVFDALDIPRCFKCNGFFHSSKWCKSASCCPRCGSAHSVSECKAVKLSCINCHKIRSPDVATDHATWDHQNCTAYKRAVTKLRNDVLALP